MITCIKKRFLFKLYAFVCITLSYANVPKVKEIRTFYDPVRLCNSTNQKVEAVKNKPITIKKIFIVSSSNHDFSWFKETDNYVTEICFYSEEDDWLHYLGKSKLKYVCNFERVNIEGTNNTGLVATLQIKNLFDEDYGNYSVQVVLIENNNVGQVNCYATIVPDEPYETSSLRIWIFIVIPVFIIVVFSVFVWKKQKK